MPLQVLNQKKSYKLEIWKNLSEGANYCNSREINYTLKINVIDF